MSVIETALTRLLGIEHPLLLAPMGSAAGGKLAAAVTNAGGLGLVGSGYASTATIRKEPTGPATRAWASVSSSGR
jgi:nitronate monooxygenase